MPRIEPAKEIDAKAQALLDAVEKKLGTVPNIFKTMAHAPSVLEAYLNLGATLAGGSLSPQLREQIALVVSQSNECNYCLAAHTVIGKGAGLDDAQIQSSRQGQGTDDKASAAVQFALKMAQNRGSVSDEDVDALRQAGYGDAEIVEIIGAVIQITFTNYFNHVANPEVDFPAAPVLANI